MKFGIIQGSVRNPSNTAGIAKWVLARIASQHSGIEASSIDFTTIKLPLAIDSIIPAAHPKDDGPEALANSYADPEVQKWSRAVSGFDAILFVTPQYNWGIPAPLKSGIDHLFHEWADKPIGLVTFGGRGGGKCAAQLRQCIDGGVHAKCAEKGVEITLPPELIRTPARATGEDEFLKAYEEGLDGVIAELVAAVKKE